MSPEMDFADIRAALFERARRLAPELAPSDLADPGALLIELLAQVTEQNRAMLARRGAADLQQLWSALGFPCQRPRPARLACGFSAPRALTLPAGTLVTGAGEARASLESELRCAPVALARVLELGGPEPIVHPTDAPFVLGEARATPPARIIRDPRLALLLEGAELELRWSSADLASQVLLTTDATWELRCASGAPLPALRRERREGRDPGLRLRLEEPAARPAAEAELELRVTLPCGTQPADLEALEGARLSWRRRRQLSGEAEGADIWAEAGARLSLTGLALSEGARLWLELRGSQRRLGQVDDPGLRGQRDRREALQGVDIQLPEDLPAGPARLRWSPPEPGEASSQDRPWSLDERGPERRLDSELVASPEVSLALGFSGEPQGVDAALILDLAPAPGELGPLRWERLGEDGWRALETSDAGLGLTQTARLPASAPAQDFAGTALRWLRLRPLNGGWHRPVEVRGLHVNGAWLTEGAGEAHELGFGDGIAALELELPGDVLRIDCLRVAGERWRIAEPGAQLGPQERAAHWDVVEARLRFGDGRRGAIPPAGAAITAELWRGRGARIPAGSLRSVEGHPELGVRQPFASSRGRPAETPDQARARTAAWLRHRGRILSAADAEAIARELAPQLSRVEAHRREGGLTLLVQAEAGERFGAAEALQLEAALRERAVLGLELTVRLARPALLDLELRLEAPLSESATEALREAIEAALQRGHTSEASLSEAVARATGQAPRRVTTRGPGAAQPRPWDVQPTLRSLRVEC